MPNSNKNILIVIHFNNEARILNNNLKQLGYTKVSWVEDGGLAYLKLQDNTFDLVISDHVMPNMNGNELLIKMRSTQGMATIPVIICTTKAGKDNHELLMSAGANDCVVKPITEELLKEKIDKIFEKLNT